MHYETLCRLNNIDPATGKAISPLAKFIYQIDKFVEDDPESFIDFEFTAEDDGDDESKKYNPDQPRGDDGKWTDGGGSEAGDDSSGSSGSSSDQSHTQGLQSIGTVSELTKNPNQMERDWKEGLSKAESDAMTYWTDDGYHDIRKFQVDGTTSPYTGGKDVMEERIRQLDRAFEKAPKFEGTVYRGMRVKKDLYEKMAAKTQMTMKSYTSFSADEATAAGFSGSGSETVNVVLVVAKNKNGRLIRAASSHRAENEVLVKRGAKYGIRQIEDRRNSSGIGKVYIYLTEKNPRNRRKPKA